MKVSYNSLNKFFDGKLPSPSIVADKLTFHAWEIEGIEKVGDDSVLDVKVLPDKSAWALSHRGIAKDISVILNIPLVHDPLSEVVILEPVSQTLTINRMSSACDVYSAALITNVKVGPSPAWLVDTLRALGQKSINNVVDITNYVMFGLGQPLHAFDARKLGGTKITVRQAKEGEAFTSLTGEAYTLTTADAVIADGTTDAIVGLAGVKGGKSAEVDETTIDILLESAHFDALTVRKTSQRHKLRTDASTRYENGLVKDMTVLGLTHAVAMLVKDAGGTLAGYTVSGEYKTVRQPVSVSLSRINSVLGLSLTLEAVADIFERFQYAFSVQEDVITVTPPFERPDLVIPEDLIEEIGRIHGYENVASVTPEPLPLSEINKKFFYADTVRDMLIELGFSEVFTSSFCAKDTVKLANAFASDKGYLRSTLRENISEALTKNAPMAVLLGVERVKLFEIGTVFADGGETFMLALGVRSPAGYKAKTDDGALNSAIEALKTLLGDVVFESKDGITEMNLGVLIETLDTPTTYAAFVRTPDITYKTFSAYPFSSRDIAFWAPQQHANESAFATGPSVVMEAEKIIRDNAGTLLVRLTLLDKFEKDGRTSYAFRLVFQSNEKTLTEDEITSAMSRVSSSVSAKGFEVR